jgi:Fe-Mn family superoxide dismutase
MIELPDLPYDDDALEPIVSTRALRLHHDGHHGRYVAAVNDLTEGDAPTSLEDLIRSGLRELDLPLLNNACQAWNHGFFWNCMAPESSEPADPELRRAIDAHFGSLSGLRRAAREAGAGHFGSGWVWLVAHGERLSIVTTRDGDTLAVTDWTPLLVCDLWEHAYYLDYPNDRSGYLAAWWDALANWSFADAQFRAANGNGVAWTYAEGSRPQPLHSRAALTSAIEEVADVLATPAPPDAVRGARVEDLLGQIADYRRAPPQPLLDEDLERLRELDRHLRAFGVRWPDREARPTAHWAPALGGDLRFHR